MLDDVVEDYQINRRKSLVQLNSRLKKFTSGLHSGEIECRILGTGQIGRYVTERLKRGAANATINRELEILERALGLGSKCEPPKVAWLIHIPMLTEDNVRSGFLDDAGYLRLRRELPGIPAAHLCGRISLWETVLVNFGSSCGPKSICERRNPPEPRHNEKQKGPDPPYLRGYARTAAD